MKFIPLTQGKYAIVDDEDYQELIKYKWYALKQRNGDFYAYRQVMIAMHRQILNAQPGQHTDHQNHRGLDNRKSNIRICTNQQNQRNQLPQKVKKSSKYKGVTYNKRVNLWYAQIGHNNQILPLGSYKSEIEAANAYDIKAQELFGEFAHTNS